MKIKKQKESYSPEPSLKKIFKKILIYKYLKYLSLKKIWIY